MSGESLALSLCCIKKYIFFPSLPPRRDVCPAVPLPLCALSASSLLSLSQHAGRGRHQGGNQGPPGQGRGAQAGAARGGGMIGIARCSKRKSRTTEEGLGQREERGRTQFVSWDIYIYIFVSFLSIPAPYFKRRVLPR